MGVSREAERFIRAGKELCENTEEMCSRCSITIVFFFRFCLSEVFNPAPRDPLLCTFLMFLNSKHLTEMSEGLLLNLRTFWQVFTLFCNRCAEAGETAETCRAEDHEDQG